MRKVGVNSNVVKIIHAHPRRKLDTSVPYNIAINCGLIINLFT